LIERRKNELLVTIPKVEALLATRLDGVHKGQPSNALHVFKCAGRDVGREIVLIDF
jgi:hypothetical protein